MLKIVSSERAHCITFSEKISLRRTKVVCTFIDLVNKGLKKDDPNRGGIPHLSIGIKQESNRFLHILVENLFLRRMRPLARHPRWVYIGLQGKNWFYGLSENDSEFLQRWSNLNTNMLFVISTSSSIYWKIFRVKRRLKIFHDTWGVPQGCNVTSKLIRPPLLLCLRNRTAERSW